MDKTERSEIISILVVNEPGVTARLGSLFARRGFNIDSFTASPTNDPKLTRITIATTGDDRKFDQMLTQTAKQEFVKTVDIMSAKSIYRELLLLKVKADKKDRSQIKEIVEIYRRHHRPSRTQTDLASVKRFPIKKKRISWVVRKSGESVHPNFD